MRGMQEHHSGLFTVARWQANKLNNNNNKKKPKLKGCMMFDR